MNQQPAVKDASSKPPPQAKQSGVTSAESTTIKTDKARSDGVGDGVVTGVPPLVSAPARVAPVRHILPQIPTMSHSRLAVSKASSKVQHILLYMICMLMIGCYLCTENGVVLNAGFACVIQMDLMFLLPKLVKDKKLRVVALMILRFGNNSPVVSSQD